MKKHHATSCYAGLIAAVSLLSACPAFGQVAAFSTLSSGTYSQVGAFAVVGNTSTGGEGTLSVAASFVPTTSGDLSSIEVGMTELSAGSDFGNFTLSLVADSGGSPNISNVLATSPEMTTTEVEFTTESALETWTYTGSTLALSAGTTYWLVAAPWDANTHSFWNTASTTSSTSTTDDLVNGAVSDTTTKAPEAFVVNVIPTPPVPEPTTALFGLAVTGVCAVARRRRSQGVLVKSANGPSI